MMWLVEVALKSTAILAAAWLGAKCLRRRPASERHVWWCAAVAAIAALPILTAVLPPVRFAVPVPASLAVDTGYRYTADAFTSGREGASPAAPAPASTGGAPAGTWDWSRAMFWLWAAGTAAAVLRLLGSHLAVARMMHRARPVDGADWRNARAEAAAQLGAVRSVRLVWGAPGTVPMTFGWLRPAIALPPEAARWDDDRRRVVLLHELAHVERFDTVSGAVSRLALCAYWFHPLAWLAERELLQTRERAADDLVLGAGPTASGYASHLLDIASTCVAPAAAAAAAECMARHSQLEARLAAILDATVARGPARPALAALAALAAVLAAAPLAAMRPQAEATPAVSAAEMDTLIRTALAQRDEAALERLAAEMVRQHKYPEANRLAAAAVEVRALHYGVQSREYARGLAMQGGLLRRQGKWEQAEEAYQKVLALQEAAGGADASTLEFMALTARRRKDYEKAVAMYQRALALQPDARLTARLYAGLGSLEADLGRPVEAEQHFRAALQARDDGSSDSASTLELLVRLLNSRDRSGEAKPLAERAARIRQEAVAMANRPVPGGQSAVKVEEGMEAPKLVSKIEPQYSEEARAARHWGTVVLAIVIGPDGRVYSVELKESLGLGLDEQAADAVRQWVFSPGKANGTPVAVKATVEVNFRLM